MHAIVGVEGFVVGVQKSPGARLGGGRSVPVKLRRLRLSVSNPARNRGDRHPCLGAMGDEGDSKVVEGDRPQIGSRQSGPVHPALEVRWIERVASSTDKS